VSVDEVPDGRARYGCVSSICDDMCHQELNDSYGEVETLRWPCVWCIKHHMLGEGDIRG